MDFDPVVFFRLRLLGQSVGGLCFPAVAVGLATYMALPEGLNLVMERQLYVSRFDALDQGLLDLIR
jgi:hypothetical protein